MNHAINILPVEQHNDFRFDPHSIPAFMRATEPDVWPLGDGGASMELCADGSIGIAPGALGRFKIAGRTYQAQGGYGACWVREWNQKDQRWWKWVESTGKHRPWHHHPDPGTRPLRLSTMISIPALMGYLRTIRC